MINNSVDFYDKTGYVMSMPLQDFNEIVTIWRDFLIKTPLSEL